MRLLDRLSEAVNAVRDTITRGVSDVLGFVRGSTRVEPRESYQEVDTTPTDTDPFSGYYQETEEEQHQRITEFEEMVEYLEDFGEFEPPAERYAYDDEIDPQYLRHVRYTTPEEAQQFLYEAGIAHFSEIVEIRGEGLYTIAVYTSPKPEAA